jgi:hypothetical protein
MHQIGFARRTLLTAVVKRREKVGPPDKIDIRIWPVLKDLFDYVFDANHGETLN